MSMGLGMDRLQDGDSMTGGCKLFDLPVAMMHIRLDSEMHTSDTTPLELSVSRTLSCMIDHLQPASPALCT